MKQSTAHRVAATFFLTFPCLVVYAQTKDSAWGQIDTLSKIVGFFGIIGGFFLAYMQVSLANKVEKVKGEFTTAIFEMKSQLTEILHTEISRMQDKVALSIKELEVKMVTKADLASSKEIEVLKQEVAKEQLGSMKEQLNLISKEIFKDK